MEQKETPQVTFQQFASQPDTSSSNNKSIRFEEFIIIFPKSESFKQDPQLQVLNLKTLQWSTAIFPDSPEILNSTDDYILTPYASNSFIISGCFKAQSNPTKSIGYLGIITASRDENDRVRLVNQDVTPDDMDSFFRTGHSVSRYNDTLILYGGNYLERPKDSAEFARYNIDTRHWAAISATSGLPGQSFFSAPKSTFMGPRRSHQAVVYKDHLYIFGGVDRQGNLLEDIWRYGVSKISSYFATSKWEKNLTSFKILETTKPSEFSQHHFAFSVVQDNQIILVPRTSFPDGTHLFVFTVDEQNNVSLTSKTKLPENSYLHCLEVYEKRIILGMNSNFYIVNLDGSSAALPLQVSTETTTRTTSLIPETKSPKTSQEQTRQYFEEKPFADLVFKVQGTEIKAHKEFIADKCSYFQQMFSNGLKEATEIEVNDITPTTFNTILEWIYCNEVKHLDEKIAQEILTVADKFSLPDLKKVAEKCLIDRLTVGNVAERAHLAETSKAGDLEKAIVKFIVDNLDAVFEKHDAESLPQPIFLQVCKGGK